MADWNERCRAHFELVDAATRDLARATGLACPPACGACCLSPHVEATVAELRPLAAALVDDGRAEGVRALLLELALAGEGRCALYEPDPEDARRGRCGAYAQRPLMCRLFGFAARRDRLGAPELMACATMAAAAPGTVEDARRAVRAGATAPIAADRVHALAADAGDGALVPINEGLLVALERELLARRLAALELDAREDEDPDGARPRPRRPSGGASRRRRAA